MKRLDWLAHLLDERFRVPGTRFRFGLDGLIGLIPGAGDLVTAAVSAYIVLQALQLGVSKRAKAKMIRNVLVDAVVGSIPLFGDLFDIGWKANRKNVRILQEELLRRPGSADASFSGRKNTGEPVD